MGEGTFCSLHQETIEENVGISALGKCQGEVKIPCFKTLPKTLQTAIRITDRWCGETDRETEGKSTSDVCGSNLDI